MDFWDQFFSLYTLSLVILMVVIYTILVFSSYFIYQRSSKKFQRQLIDKTQGSEQQLRDISNKLNAHRQKLMSDFTKAEQRLRQNTQKPPPDDDDDFWFGFEQEYFFYQDGEPLGWKKGEEPAPQGQYYCGVGSKNIAGREISEKHLIACLDAGIQLTGTNAEVALGQWEYQCFGKGVKAGDDLWVSRYLLYEIAEE